jgi:hypothetical protein
VDAVMKNIKEKITLENVIMVGIFIIVSITLFWKCRYGCAFTTDEGFYPTFANRLLQFGQQHSGWGCAHGWGYSRRGCSSD